MKLTLTLAAFAALVSSSSAQYALDRDAQVRRTADRVLAMSEADYRAFAASRDDVGSARISAMDRPAVLARIYAGIAAARFRAAADAGLESDKKSAAQEEVAGLTAVGLSVGGTEEAGFWGDFNAWVEQPPRRENRVVAVAAVRGGRELSPDQIRALTGSLAALDATDAPLSDPASSPLDKAKRLYESGQAYARLAKSLEAAPVAAAKPTMTPKEIYQAVSPSVVLILAARKDGAGELGTGSAVDETGRILTNAHVIVDDATTQPYPNIRIYLKPTKVTGDPKQDLGEPIPAKVARFDRALDLAVLEPTRTLGVAPLRLGDDSTVNPGDSVVAIGHPEQGGLWSLTQGIISARVATLGGVIGKDAFQTDASINRGNSGGPLLDQSGAIVGINTSMARKAADGLTITSVNFSLRSSVAKRWLSGATMEGASPTVEAAPIAAPPAAAATPRPKATILTPATPFRAEDVLAREMKEMEDLEKEMQGEIQQRRRH